MQTHASEAIFIIAALAIGGVILRPFNLPEAVWALAGAALLVILRLISIPDVLAALGRGTDVYLFLLGMMLLAELAREEGLFDWLAAVATNQAQGSARRLFLLTYCVGTIVTIFLSNDATAVVLTPAVAAAVKAANTKQPLPYLLICAFIANAASFVLPISNPANLVIYGSHMPPLLQWLPAYALPSVLAIAATYAALRFTQRHALRQEVARRVARPTLTPAGRAAAIGIAATAVVLLASSVYGLQLGLPTALAGTATATIVLLRERNTPLAIFKNISWGVLLLVAGLFVLVEALGKTGLISTMAALLRSGVQESVTTTALIAGIFVAFAVNLVNNLSAALLAGSTVQAAHISGEVTRAALIGIDLGPNLSVTGSLATILWLIALRREGLSIGLLTFLKLGITVMPPALLLAITAALWLG